MTDMLPTGDLPSDVLVSILLKLPIKSLLRFKAVCKSWNDFLNSPTFIKIHLQSTTKKLLMPRFGVENTFLTLGFGTNGLVSSVLALDSPDELHLMDSCNGLVCLRFDDNSQIILWNPATRKYKQIELPDHDSFFGPLPGIGMGCVPETNDYKIVCFSATFPRNSKENDMFVWVYSLRSDSWKMVHVFPHASLIGPPTLANGCLHWIITRNDVTDQIIAFDLRTEILHSLSLPFPVQFGYSTSIVLTALEGSLFVVVSLEIKRNYRRFEVWMMTNYGANDSWIKLFDVGPISFLLRPAGSWMDRMLLFANFGQQNEMFGYDFFTNMFDFEFRGCDPFPTLMYVESLESVDGGEDR